MVHAVALLATLAACAAVADAHSSMAVPKPTYPPNFYTYMNPVMRIDSTGMETSIPGYKGVEKITAVMKGQSSLKSFIMSKAVLTGTGSATKECGWALADGEKQPLPAAVDFPWAHPGPCEVWCDNTKVLYNDNCMGNNVGKVSLAGKCAGAKMIQAMYVGTHVENWEVYMSCAPIGTGGGSAAAGGAASGGAAPASTPAAGGDADEYDDAPAATPAATKAPSPAATPKLTPSASSPASAPAPAPAATKKPNCVKRRRN